MISSLVGCLGCLLEPPVSVVTATGVNWCIWCLLDCNVISARGSRFSACTGPTSRGAGLLCGHAYVGTCRSVQSHCRSSLCVLLAVLERALVTPERALDRASVDRVVEVNLLTKLTVISALSSFLLVC